MPPVQELMKEIAKGKVGALQMLAIREHRFPFLEKVGDWNRFSRRTGGTLVEKCCHFFDLMRLIMADEPCARLRVGRDGREPPRRELRRREARYPRQCLCHRRFPLGATGDARPLHVRGGRYWQETIAATGDKGRAEIFIPGPARFWPGGEERHSEIEVSPRKPKGPKRRVVEVDHTILKAGDHHGSTYYQHLGFHRAVTKGAAVEVTLEDGLKAVLIGLAAEKSAKTGKAVPLAF